MDFYAGEMVKVSAILPHSEGGGMKGRVVGWKAESVDIDFLDGSEGWVDREYVLPVDAEDPATIEQLIDAAADALAGARAWRDYGSDFSADLRAVDAAKYAMAALAINERSTAAESVLYAIETQFGSAARRAVRIPAP